MGLCGGRQLRGLYMVGVDGLEASGMVEFDEALRPVHVIPLARVNQAHSIAPFRDGYLLNSSGDDSLGYVTPDSAEGARQEIFWRAGNGSHDFHINSVCVVGSHVLITMFGPREDGGWFDSHSGSVRDVTAGREICNGLIHPHTLFQMDGRLCVLESFTGSVLELTGGTPCELFRVPGYARGAAVDGAYLYIATSKTRMRSKHTGAVRRRIKIRSTCAIHRIHIASGEMQTWDLRYEGREIYDLLVF